MELTGRANKPITVATAKRRGLVALTHHYLKSEFWMVHNVLADLRRSDIEASVVKTTENIPGAVEVWRK
jgi:hypothetical protein